jgi:hypothetical protein
MPRRNHQWRWKQEFKTRGSEKVVKGFIREGWKENPGDVEAENGSADCCSFPRRRKFFLE